MSIVLGLNPGFGGFNYHDPSACLVVDGRVVAAVEEERFTRVKSAPGVFPTHAVGACLRIAGLDIGDLDAVAIGYSTRNWLRRLPLETATIARAQRHRNHERENASNPDPHRVREDLARAGVELADLALRSELFDSEGRAAERIRDHIPGLEAPIQFVEHHRAHAASAIYPSGFDAPIALVLDGLGEIEAGSAWAALPEQRIDRLESTDLPNSLGYFYAGVTEYLGFRGWEGEGKTMALAPYGREDRGIAVALASIARADDDGYDVSEFVRPCLGPQLSLDTSLAVAALRDLFGVPPRRPDDKIEKVHESIAWAAQQLLERAVTGTVRRLAAAHGAPIDLVFAGGVALNCKLNMTLRHMPEIARMYVPGFCSDSGLSVGAALDVAAQVGDDVRRPIPSLALGPVAEPDGATYLERMKIPFERVADAAATAARLIADGRIVMWCHGRSEFGPRALGSRSILADPRREDMKVLVNEVVKHREVWRPFGPSMLAEHAHLVLEDAVEGEHAPYMVSAYRVREEWVARIPAVVHTADGSTRPQLVEADTLPEYHRLIEAFYSITDVPLVLNTSFNDKGEPLVQTTRNAVRHFFSSAADVLIIDGLVVTKSSS